MLQQERRRRSEVGEKKKNKRRKKRKKKRWLQPIILLWFTAFHLSFSKDCMPSHAIESDGNYYSWSGWIIASHLFWFVFFFFHFLLFHFINVYVIMSLMYCSSQKQSCILCSDLKNWVRRFQYVDNPPIIKENGCVRMRAEWNIKKYKWKIITVFNHS